MIRCVPSLSYVRIRSLSCNQILGLVADNASNNNTLVAELAEDLDGFEGSLYRIRCIAHILNLVVKAIISQFVRKPKKKNNDGDAPTNDADDPDEEDILLDELEVEADEEDVAAAEDVDDDREAADCAILDEISGDVEFTHPVTASELKVGHLSVSKVCRTTLTPLPSISLI